MKDLIDEVSEDLQEEKNRALIQKAVKFFSSAAIIIVVGTIFYVWKDRSLKNLRNQLGFWYAESVTLTENNKFDEALGFLDKIIEHSHQQYAILAYLNKAAILLKQNKFAEAQEVLLDASKQKHFDRSLREMAQLTYLSNILNNGKIEDHANAESLDNLIKDNKPWQISGLQLKALYDIKQGKIDEARSRLGEILKSKKAIKSSYDVASSILASIPKSE